MFPPSQFETVFISSAHSDEDIKKTSDICVEAIMSLENKNK